MDINYQIIRTTTEKIKLYRFRKQVFVDEEQRFKTDSDHITDLYDGIDETVNLAAFHNGRIIAAMRMTMENKAGFPVDQHWDFAAYRAGLTGPCVAFGWLCCARAFRQQKGLIRTLIAKGAEQAKKRKACHVLAVIHPPIFEMLHNNFGGRQIGTPFTDPHMNVEMLPIHVGVDEILDRYSGAVSRDELPDQISKTHSLSDQGIRGKFHFLEQAYSRNLGILSPAEQEKILNSRIAIPGLGGVGGQHLITLARTGIGKFTLADFDTFEVKNINRQYGARQFMN